jgi:hypothetical protein
MPFGPGKYDDIATQVRGRCEADGVVLIVHNGHLGSGFSVQAPADFSQRLPLILRVVADEIERSTPSESAAAAAIHAIAESRLSTAEEATFRAGCCPQCGGHLTEGPHGGLAVNYRCDNCRQLYCELGPIGVERIAER